MTAPSEQESSTRWLFSPMAVAIAALIIALLWFRDEPGYEPLGVVIAALGGLVGIVAAFALRRVETKTKIPDILVASLILIATVVG